MKEDRFIIGIGQGEHEYVVNGVKYIVDSVFRPFDFKNIKNTQNLLIWGKFSNIHIGMNFIYN